MVLPFTLQPLFTVNLHHAGDCSLIGILPDGTLYAEEIYEDDGWMAQHQIDPDGNIVTTVDEMNGDNAPLTGLPIPDAAVTPARVWHTMALNYVGPRHRGLRGLERVDALVRTLAIPEKVQVIKQLGLNLPAPMLIGMAESYVLSEAQVIAPDWFIVCRRVRFAYALMEEQTDGDGFPYDYDTAVLYGAHVFHRSEDEVLPMEGLLENRLGVDMNRPMECAIVGDRLYIGDGGSAASGRVSQIHVWRVERPDSPSPDDTWLKKLYG